MLGINLDFSLFFYFYLICLLVGFMFFMIKADADVTLLLYEKFAPKKRFDGKIVWITGASSGIGEYLAYDFAKLGAKLALSGVNVERLQKVKTHCHEISGCGDEDILLVPFTMEKFEQHEECVNKVLEHFKDIHILVNNAGISQRADFVDIDIEVDQKLFNINVLGPVNLTRKVLKHFIEKNDGHIVATSSMAGKLGAPFSSAYTGSKHAMHGYFECLRSEMSGKNIHVTIACPGPVFSGLTDRCFTGKLGEKYDFKQQPTDFKMKTERCSELMTLAIAHKLDETWICLQPILFMYYLSQYFPTIFRSVIVKVIFSRKRVMAYRQGR